MKFFMKLFHHQVSCTVKDKVETVSINVTISLVSYKWCKENQKYWTCLLLKWANTHGKSRYKLKPDFVWIRRWGSLVWLKYSAVTPYSWVLFPRWINRPFFLSNSVNVVRSANANSLKMRILCLNVKYRTSRFALSIRLISTKYWVVFLSCS